MPVSARSSLEELVAGVGDGDLEQARHEPQRQREQRRGPSLRQAA